MMVSSTSTSTSLRPVDAGEQRRAGLPSAASNRERDGVELADMAEGERPQERPQRRGRVGAVEHPAHPAVPQQRHVIDAVGAGDHPRDQRGDLRPRVRALVGRHAQVLIGQLPQPGRLGQPPSPGPARRTTPDSGHRRPPRRDRPSMRELHLRDALPCVGSGPRQVPISQHARAFSFYDALEPAKLIGRVGNWVGGVAWW